MQFVNMLVAHAITWLPRALVRHISRRYIAGNNLEEAVIRVRELNALGLTVTIDVLGETPINASQVTDTANQYVQVLQAIDALGLNAGISVKPTALGLLLDPVQCERLFAQIACLAQSVQRPVCMDMEDVQCTQMEIDLFSRLKQGSDTLGLAVQAYLKRSYNDIEKLLALNSTLRICKGIYVEGKEYLVPHSWHDRSAINSHFVHHVTRCFDVGVFVEIATHDEALIHQIIGITQQRGIARTQFEFQMLLGVCEPLRDRLLEAGFQVRIYVPFGEDWYAYSVRRLKENPRIVGYIMKAMLRI